MHTKYEIIFDSNTSNLWAQWHCPICGSTMSSGEWFADVREALIECGNNMREHLTKTHKTPEPNHEAEERVRKWAMEQELDTFRGGTMFAVRCWVKFWDGSQLPIQRAIPDEIESLLELAEDDGYTKRYRVSAATSS